MSRYAEPDGAFELWRLQQAARYAEGTMWLRAAVLIRSGDMTAEQVAKVLKCSRTTVFRQLQKWNDHLDQGNGVGA